MTSPRSGTEVLVVDLPTELMSRLRDLVGGELLHRFITAAVAERLRESTGDHPAGPAVRPGDRDVRPSMCNGATPMT